MIFNIFKNKKLKEDNKRLEKEVRRLETVINDFLQSESDPIKVVEKIMNGNVRWFDYTKLKGNDAVNYYNGAREILNNPVFINEFNAIINEWAVWAFKQSQNFAGVRDMRMNANGLQLLKERFEKIPNPIKVSSQDNINEAI